MEECISCLASELWLWDTKLDEQKLPFSHDCAVTALVLYHLDIIGSEIGLNLSLFDVSPIPVSESVQKETVNLLREKPGLSRIAGL